MTTEPRRIALSSPLRHARPRFAVGGQGQAGSGDVKVYEWVRETQEMRMIGLQTDLGQIRAMAWSPHPTHPSILAIGLSTGRTTIHSLSPSTLITSPNIPNNPLATLQIKHSRPVTSLSFSPLDPNYVAAGLERHRSDHSLLVWDVADAIASSPSEGSGNWTRPGERIDVTNAHMTSRISEPRHLQAYCASELVNSCAFLPASYLLLGSTNNRQIRLFDLRSSHSTTQIKDAAAAGAGAVLQYQTRAVYGLTPHPTRTERFASFELGQTGSVVRIWDTRRSGEILSFEVGDAVMGLEWRGDSLGVGSRDGGVNMWEVVSGKGKNEEKDWVTIGGSKNVVRPRQHLHSFAFTASERAEDVLFVGKDGVINIAPMTSSPATAMSPQGELALSKHISDTTILTPDSSTHRNPHQQGPNARRSPHTARAEGLTPANKFLPRQPSEAQLPFTPGAGPSRHRLPHEIPEAASSDSGEDALVQGYEAWKGVSADDIGAVMRKRAEEGYGLQDIRGNGVAASRYPDRENLAEVWNAADHITQYMAQSTSRTPDDTYDMSHQGIWGIWTGQISPPFPSQPSSSTSRTPHLPGEPHSREPIKQGSQAWTSLKSQTQAPTTGTAASGFRPRTQSTTARAGRGSSLQPVSAPRIPAPGPAYIAAVNAMLQLKADLGVLASGEEAKRRLPGGERTPLRRLILGLCESVAGKKRDRVATSPDTDRTRSAAWAYFAGDDATATQILLESTDPHKRLMGATLATSLLRSGSNRKPKREEWDAVIQGMEDPHIRAVLRRLGGDTWEIVLNGAEQDGLRVLDRVIIAVTNLEDEKLTDYLYTLHQNIMDTSATPSLISALPLLGLTSHLIPLLRSYLDQSSDLQTTCLLAALIPATTLTPRQRSLVDGWTEGYRDLLDSWKMFDRRVEFDVRRQEIARDLGAVKVDYTKGNCPVCNHVLSRQELDHAQRKIALKGTTIWPNERTYTCTFCSNALPRCAICLTHVESRFKAGHGFDEDYIPAGNELMDTIDTAYVACQTCRHGGHAGHILPWFEGGLDGQMGHDVCPVVGCDCNCAEL